MKHYIIQERKGEFFILNHNNSVIDHANVGGIFGALKWAATFARAGHSVSYVNMETMEERVVCQQAPELVK